MKKSHIKAAPYTRHDKDTSFNSQKQVVFRYLSKNIATATMVSKATGIAQKNICRHKRTLQKAGLLHQVERKMCRCSGFLAWYLSTNPELLRNGNK
ncbi:hypothetical protein [Dysgonomonas alginatilytica]|uniref:hypothetical protein n=1 Tax=Dysgonomonas alginatilytica TaxID=1605892 RepID=UPI000D7548FF|nr:hypothetical protein [Dysgonomonas alginatilytica]